jgi:hypothetical protein
MSQMCTSTTPPHAAEGGLTRTPDGLFVLAQHVLPLQVATSHHHNADESLPPAELMHARIDARPSGSYVVLSHFYAPWNEHSPIAHRVQTILNCSFFRTVPRSRRCRRLPRQVRRGRRMHSHATVGFDFESARDAAAEAMSCAWKSGRRCTSLARGCSGVHCRPRDRSRSVTRT